jgi:hypothetical protein
MKVSCQHCALATLLSGESAPGTHSVGGWVGPGTSLDTSEQRKNSSSCRELNLGHPDRSLLLYWLSYHNSQRMKTYMACENCLLTLVYLFIGHVLKDYCQFFMSYFMKWLMECIIPSRAVAPKCYPFHEIVKKCVLYFFFFLPYVLTHVSMQLGHV